jgi:hypothetical protein
MICVLACIRNTNCNFTRSFICTWNLVLHHMWSALVWECMRTGSSGKCFDLRGEKQQEAGENCALKSLPICTPRNRGGWDSRTCDRGEIGNAYAVLIGEAELKRPLGRYGRRWNSFSAGSNTSTVVLRVVGDVEKGSLESETVKYGHKSQGTGTWKLLCWRGPAAIVNDRPVLSSERAP